MMFMSLVRECAGSLVLIAVLAIVLFTIILPPMFAPSHPQLFKAVQILYSPTCHQLISRSFCWFPREARWADCGDVSGRGAFVVNNGEVGFKMPVCARCFGIYVGALLGALAALALVFTRFFEPTTRFHPAFFLFSLAPMAIDGTLQLFGFYASTNFIRLSTGLLAGFATGFYAVPVMNLLFNFSFHYLNARKSSKEPKEKS